MFNDPRWVEVKSTGEQTGQEFFGKFKLKPFLKHKERADAVRLAEAYSLGINRTDDQRLFLTTLAFLKFHVVETDADWWNEGSGLDLLDEDPVFEVARQLNKIQEEINPSKKAASKKGEENQEDGSASE